MSKGKFKNALVNSFKIFKASVSNFGSDRPIQLASTTAYFAIFSMTPIILIIISVFGYFTGDDIIREKLFNEIAVLLGHDSTLVLRKATENYNISGGSFIGILGILFFLIAATALFSIMQNSINHIWRIKAKANFKMGILSFLKKRVLSFGVILCLGFILLISLLIDASIAFLKDLLATQFNHNFVLSAQLINVAASLIIITVVFALIYRFLPDVHIHWSASWFGAVFTSVLFALGKIGIGAIIVNINFGAFYGAVGSFSAILVWIFFVSIIFYFGVELTSQYSKFYNHENKPMKYAVPFRIDKV
jgi:membrane protein